MRVLPDCYMHSQHSTNCRSMHGCCAWLLCTDASSGSAFSAKCRPAAAGDLVSSLISSMEGKQASRPATAARPPTAPAGRPRAAGPSTSASGELATAAGAQDSPRIAATNGEGQLCSSLDQDATGAGGGAASGAWAPMAAAAGATAEFAQHAMHSAAAAISAAAASVVELGLDGAAGGAALV